MDESAKAIRQWSLGFGDMNERLFGKKAGACQVLRAIRSDWKTHRMPRTHTRLELGLDIDAEEFEVLARGHIPHAMEDHWFMYFDGDSFCFHRSWTWYCIFKVHAVRSEGGFLLDYVTVNRKAEQYAETSDERDALLAAILVGEAVGRDVGALWEAYFAAGVGKRS